MISNEQLEYQTHFSGYQQYLTGIIENDFYWHFQAQDMHALHVLDAIRDLQVEVLALSGRVPNEEAATNLNFGAARRVRMIWGGFRHLYSLIRPDRSEPMMHDDVFEAARALNDIYIHTRGVLDNYAWVLVLLFGNVSTIRRTDVDLFGRRLESNLALKIVDVLAPYRDWNREIKARRDPVAHRIPLSVPPSFFNEEDHAHFLKLNDRYSAAVRRFSELALIQASQSDLDAASAEADRLHEESQRVGRFSPIIVHDPKEGGTRIYPTVPQDIGTLVRVVRKLNERIASSLAT